MKKFLKKSIGASVAASLLIAAIPVIGFAEGEEASSVVNVFKAEYNAETVVDGAVRDGKYAKEGEGRFPWTSNYPGGDKWINSVAAATRSGYPYAAGAQDAQESYQIKYGVAGKTKDDGALLLSSASNLQYDVPIQTGVDNVNVFDSRKSGFPRIDSLEMITANNMGEGKQTRVSFDIMKNDDEEFLIENIFRATDGNRQGMGYVFGINRKNNIVLMYGDTGVQVKKGEWYSVDLVYTYGSDKIDCYLNGKLVAAQTQFKHNNANVTKTYKCMYKVTMATSNASQVITDTYIDNFNIDILSGDAIMTADSFNETFDSYVSYPEVNTGDNYKWIYRANMPAANGYAMPAEKGMFGKSADDTSACIEVKEFGENQTVEPYIQTTDMAMMHGWRYGDKIRLGIKLAFDETDFMAWNTYITPMVTGINAKGDKGNSADNNNNLNQMVLIRSNELIFDLMGTRVSKEVKWVPYKWYNFEFVIEPGNANDIKNKISLYLDGELVGETKIDAINHSNYVGSAIEGIWRMKVGKLSTDARYKTIPGYVNRYVGTKTYIDDYYYEKLSAETEIAEVKVTADSSIGTSYEHALLVKNNETVADMKKKIAVDGAKCEYVNEAGVPADDNDQAAGTYLKLTTNDGKAYFYNISDKIVVYNADFEKHPLSDYNGGAGYRLMGANNIDATLSSQTLGGKSGYGLAFDYTRTKTEQYDGSNVDTVLNAREQTDSITGRRNYKIPVADKTTLEIQMYVNEEDWESTSKGLGWTFELTDENGKTKRHDIVPLLHLENGVMFAGRRWDTDEDAYKEIGSYENGQWYKFAFELDPTTLTADVYVNGVKAAEGVKFARPEVSEGCRMSGIMRLKLGYTYLKVDELSNGTIAYDDIKVYAGNYDAAKDSDVNITCDDFTISGNKILVNSDYDNLELNAFKNQLTVTGDIKSIDIYDDYNCNSKDIVETDGLIDGSVLAIESNSGVMRYYTIRDIAAEAGVIKFYNEGKAVDGIIDAGTYTAKLILNNTNNDESCLFIIATYDDGMLVSADCKDVTLTSGLNEIEHSVEVEEISSDKFEIKAFVWSNGTLKPYADSANIKFPINW